MAVDVLTQIVIARPRAEVAAFAADPDNAPRWYVNIKSVAWQTPPPLTVGSRITFRAEFLGRQLSYLYEVVQYAPLQLLVMRTAQGPFPMETSYHWRDDAQGTRMELRNRGNPSGFGRLLTPLMGMAMRRANRKDLVKLKQILERGEA